MYDLHMDHEYAGIIGLPDFCKGAANLAFGEGSDVIKNKLVCLHTFITSRGSLLVASALYAQSLRIVDISLKLLSGNLLFAKMHISCA